MHDNREKLRYELKVDNRTVYAEYKLLDDELVISYVFSPPELRGRGAAGRLMEEILALSKVKNWKIRPLCGYAAAWLKKHNAPNVVEGAT